MARGAKRFAVAFVGLVLSGCANPNNPNGLAKLGATLESMSNDPQTAQMGAWRLSQINAQERCAAVLPGNPESVACSQPAPRPTTTQETMVIVQPVVVTPRAPTTCRQTTAGLQCM